MNNRSRFFASSNPFLSEQRFQSQAEHGSLTSSREGYMTVQGAVQKSAILTAIMFVTAAIGWNMASTTLLIVGLIGGLIFGLWGLFRPQQAPIVAPLYAVFEGLLLGVISFVYASAYSGIVPMALGLTFAVLAVMLLLYKTGIVQPTERFKSIMSIGLGAIFFVYMASMLLGLFGVSVPYLHEGGPIGIGLSLVIVGFASFSLILDFETFEVGEQSQAPRYMEWAAALGLMFTVVWLYLEILRLLSKLRD